MIKKAQLPYVR